VNVGEVLLDLCSAENARSIVVVGTAKNVGKTVVAATLCGALLRRNVRFGICSVGRDGEAIDAVDAMPKPRLFLRPPALLATALRVLPASPACEMYEVSDMLTAAGPIVFAGVRTPAYFELVGPPTAFGIRRVKRSLFAFGAQRVVVDGAVDRLAALAGEEDDAVIVATGAADAATPQATVAEVSALVARLQTPAYDPAQPHVRIAGALGAREAAALLGAREARQIVVRDPTQIALRGRALLAVRDGLRLRCERPLRIVAVTVASIGGERYFEPREFARAVASATGLPTFDAYAGTVAAA
jgi:hypothetical protein